MSQLKPFIMITNEYFSVNDVLYIAYKLSDNPVYNM